jgi:hypothetical protein|eukprot:6895407-Prymnesium_polylepis.4
MARITSAMSQVAKMQAGSLNSMKTSNNTLMKSTRSNSFFTFQTSEVKTMVAAFQRMSSNLKIMWDFEEARLKMLEEERARKLNARVIDSFDGAGKLIHPLVLVPAEAFVRMETLEPMEVLRDSGKLKFVDNDEELKAFKKDKFFIFLSHQCV